MDGIFDENIHPCKGCEDYIPPNDCKSKGGCGMDRLISLNTVIDTMNDWLANSTDDLDNLFERIKTIPSAEPKTGHWIEEDIWGGLIGWKCSKCGHKYDISHQYTKMPYNFCPNCGSSMEIER